MALEQIVKPTIFETPLEIIYKKDNQVYFLVDNILIATFFYEEKEEPSLKVIVGTVSEDILKRYKDKPLRIFRKADYKLIANFSPNLSGEVSLGNNISNELKQSLLNYIKEKGGNININMDTGSIEAEHLKKISNVSDKLKQFFLDYIKENSILVKYVNVTYLKKYEEYITLFFGILNHLIKS